MRTVIIGLVIALVVILAVALAVWVRRARSAGRTVSAPADQERERLFVGDVMRKHLITSGGLARLEVFPWGVRVRGMPLTRWVVSTWEASFDEIAMAELVATEHSRIAVWLRLRGEPGQGTAFLSGWNEDILRQLDKHDVPVSRAVTKIRGAAELYSTPS